MTIDWSRLVGADEKREMELLSSRAKQKAEKQGLVSEILVTVDGLVFQGDEISQGRMLRRAETMVADEKVSWRLADNSLAIVTADQLRAAAREAVDEMGRILVGTR